MGRVVEGLTETCRRAAYWVWRLASRWALADAAQVPCGSERVLDYVLKIRLIGVTGIDDLAFAVDDEDGGVGADSILLCGFCSFCEQRVFGGEVFLEELHDRHAVVGIDRDDFEGVL